MKLYIEIDATKTDGPKCDPSEVVEAIMDLLDGERIYPQHEDADDESEYEVATTRPLSVVLTLATIREGDFPKTAKFLAL